MLSSRKQPQHPSTVEKEIHCAVFTQWKVTYRETLLCTNMGKIHELEIMTNERSKTVYEPGGGYKGL